MKQNSIYLKRAYWAKFTVIALTSLFAYTQMQAQNLPCTNSVTLYNETFGTGAIGSSPDVTPVLTYSPAGSLFDEGIYRLADNIQQKIEWHSSADHTGDANGRMLVVNGTPGVFYSHTINNPVGFAAGSYYFRYYAMNANVPYACFGNPLLADINLIAEYQDANGNWIPFTNSPYAGGLIPTSDNPVWLEYGSTFILPATGNFQVTNIRVSLNSLQVGGCGNDFAIDDIGAYYCPEGGPMPVNFLSINALVKGNAVSVQWSTAFEVNNKYYEIQRSSDGNGWSVIAVLNSRGNTNTTQNYQVYDAKPLQGVNLYRIKQVDFGGSSTFSTTAKVKFVITKTDASVRVNPFINDIDVDFVSVSNQSVTARLYDITGKLVLSENWMLSKGSLSRKMSTHGLGNGMYILSVTGENNTPILRTKLVKN